MIQARKKTHRQAGPNTAGAPARPESRLILPQILKTLMAVIGEKDPYLREHANRVASTCVHFAQRLGAPKAVIDRLYLAGLLHDLGMVTVPLEIIRQDEPLSDEDAARLQDHPLTAERVLKDLSIARQILPLIRHHHERYDGTGYPDRLAGDDIPLEARILGLIDCFWSLNAPRPARPNPGAASVLETLAAGAGTHFDPRLTSFLVKLISSAAGTAHPPPDPHARPSAAPGSAREVLDNVLRRFKKGELELPVLPKVVQHIQKAVEQPGTCAEDIAAVIEQDAVISVRLIAVANSPMYRATGKITSVKQAVPRLGMKETINIVAGIASRNLYSVHNPEFMLLMEKLWVHALATAGAAREVAKALALGDPDKFYLMGLIHDIGKVLLIRAVTESGAGPAPGLQEVIDCVQEAHTHFGATMLEHWEFTPDFVRVAEQHNSEHYSAKTSRDVLVVSLANRLTRTIGCSIFPDEGPAPGELETAKLLGIDSAKIEAIAQSISSSIKTAAQFL